MKVTQVALRPTEASLAAGRPALTPELLAASGARYSRNNEGLDAILAKIDPENLDRSVDSIFRMIDYGHQSIADMAPVAMFLDGLSLWLAYYVWTLCPTAGGQESSTRYIQLSPEALPDPEALGIPGTRRAGWRGLMEQSFAAYQEALSIWEGIAADDPDVARIPRSLQDDPAEKTKKQVARMRRNYGFDRARYFLPAAALTNVMLLLSARGWVQLCQHLFSHPLSEAQRLGALIADELRLCAPRLLKHAARKESIESGIRREFEAASRLAASETPDSGDGSSGDAHRPTPFLQVMLPDGATNDEIADDLRFHDNRYAWMGESLKRTAVRFGWEAVAFAEIRDLNRHRTGTRSCPLIPRGFYAALDQLPDTLPDHAQRRERLVRLSAFGAAASQAARALLRAGDPNYVYETQLGTQYRFEHLTTADKFLYEAELRTGAGAHFRYARHLHDALQLWYERFPETRGLVLEGSAEPE